jgi:hypothetical protein
MKGKSLATAIAVMACALGAATARADFRDGTIFPDTAANGRLDLGPLFVFRSPANANNTVLVLTVSPFTHALTPATFVKGARYDIAIDKTGDYVADMVLRTTFGSPSGNDLSQRVLVRCLPKPRCRRYVVVRGRTGQNVPVPGGGTFRAADQDNPEFFDQAAWDSYVADGMGTFPRPVGMAKDFYGPFANSLAIVLELPSVRIAPNASVIAVWGRTLADGGRRDREGRPFVDTGMIPKVPRNSPAPERRDAFNVGGPAGDVAGFTADMTSVFMGFYMRSMADAGFLAKAFLPDVAMFQIGNPGGYGTLVGGAGTAFSSGPFAGGQVLGNGRQLRDDVHDINLNLMTNGMKPSDNVGDDNGLAVSDGSVDPVSGKTRTIAFPYLAPPNNAAAGPNP